MQKLYIDKHPCFNKDAHNKYARIHLPIAPKCNISCRYCERKFDCPNESRPGVASKILNVEEAMEKLDKIVESEVNLKVIGIAGPGEPLFNEETFEFLEKADKKYPHLLKCLSSNGLLVGDKIDDIVRCNVGSLTITINGDSEEVLEKIYRKISCNKKVITYEEFLEKQWMGVKKAVEKDIIVKINTVLIPGVNEDEIIDIAKKAKEYGVYKMNIMPLIPQGDFKEYKKPSKDELYNIRETAKEYISQIDYCKQCRADACGVPGLEK